MTFWERFWNIVVGAFAVFGAIAAAGIVSEVLATPTEATPTEVVTETTTTMSFCNHRPFQSLQVTYLNAFEPESPDAVHLDGLDYGNDGTVDVNWCTLEGQEFLAEAMRVVEGGYGMCDLLPELLAEFPHLTAGEAIDMAELPPDEARWSHLAVTYFCPELR